MDPNRFDAIARTLGTERSRRRVLKTLGGAALGALGVATASRGTAAAPGSPGGNSACAAFCAAVFGDTKAAGQCTSDAAHSNPNGLCAQCGANPANYCNRTCTDISSDINNCGSCGHVCPAPANGSATCASSACGISCDSGYGPVNGTCMIEQCWWLSNITGLWEAAPDITTQQDCEGADADCNEGGPCYEWTAQP